MIKVSVFLPVYKTEFLSEAIQSILNQTFRDFDLLIVNDFSPNNVREIIESFNDSRIIYKENAENRGKKDLVGFWNEEIKQCRGEFLVIASDDDFYAPTYLQEMLLLADKYPETDLFHCRIAYIDSEDKLIQIAQPALEFETQMDFIYQRLVWKRKQTLQEFMFRTSSLLEKGGVVSFPMAWASDSTTTYMMAEHGVAYNSDFLFSLRMSGLNISSASEKVEYKIEAMKQSIQWFQDFLPQVKCKTILDEFMKKEAIRIYESQKYASYPGYLLKLGWRNYLKELKYILKNKVFSFRLLVLITLKKCIRL